MKGSIRYVKIVEETIALYKKDGKPPPPQQQEKTTQKECFLGGVIDIANDCSDTDLSVYHDKYL